MDCAKILLVKIGIVLGAWIICVKGKRYGPCCCKYFWWDTSVEMTSNERALQRRTARPPLTPSSKPSRPALAGALTLEKKLDLQSWLKRQTKKRISNAQPLKSPKIPSHQHNRQHPCCRSIMFCRLLPEKGRLIRLSLAPVRWKSTARRRRET